MNREGFGLGCPVFFLDICCRDPCTRLKASKHTSEKLSSKVSLQKSWPKKFRQKTIFFLLNCIRKQAGVDVLVMRGSLSWQDVDMMAATGGHLYSSKNATCAHWTLAQCFTSHLGRPRRPTVRQTLSLLAMLLWAKRGNIWWKEWNLAVIAADHRYRTWLKCWRVHILSVM